MDTTENSFTCSAEEFTQNLQKAQQLMIRMSTDPDLQSILRCKSNMIKFK
jgi:hypothetical protein